MNQAKNIEAKKIDGEKEPTNAKSTNQAAQIKAIANSESLPALVANGVRMSAINNPTYTERIQYATELFGEDSNEVFEIRNLLKNKALKETTDQMINDQKLIENKLSGVDKAITNLVKQVLSSSEYIDVIANNLEDPVLTGIAKIAKKYRDVDILDGKEDEITGKIKDVISKQLEDLKEAA